MDLINQAQAHEGDGTLGSIEALMHISPDDRPVVGQPAQFHFAVTDPGKLFKVQNCNCKIFLFQGQNIIDQHEVSLPDSATPTIDTNPLYTYTFTQPGDYSIHFSGQPKLGKEFDVFALHFDVHVYATTQEANAANSNAAISAHTEHPDSADHNSWQHILSAHHFGHGIIFGGGLVAAIILFFYGVYEKRKQAKAKITNN